MEKVTAPLKKYTIIAHNNIRRYQFLVPLPSNLSLKLLRVEIYIRGTHHQAKKIKQLINIKYRLKRSSGICFAWLQGGFGGKLYFFPVKGRPQVGFGAASGSEWAGHGFRAEMPSCGIRVDFGGPHKKI